jgi:hypothetical protein
VALGERHWVRRGKDASETGYFFPAVAQGEGKTAELVDLRTGEWTLVLTWLVTRE